MKLTLNLSPVLGDTPTIAALSGTVLTLNGTAYDLAELEDGATARHPVLGRVTRDGDAYACTIALRHGDNAAEATRFPAPVVLEDHEGEIELPAFNEPTEEEIQAQREAEDEDEGAAIDDEDELTEEEQA